MITPVQATILDVEIVADCEEFSASGTFYACLPWHNGDWISYEVELILTNAQGDVTTVYTGQTDPLTGEDGCFDFPPTVRYAMCCS